MEFLLDEVRTRGRAARPVTGTVMGELTVEDLGALAVEKGSAASPIKRLSERHHALARTLASGVKPGEAAIICGYDPSRVSILQDDPTFKELLAFYRDDTDRAYHGLHEMMAGMSMDAVSIMRSRMEEEEEKITFGQLLEAAKMGADRTGHGPSSTTTNLNVNVDLANRMEAARKRVAERRAKLIDVTANDES